MSHHPTPLTACEVEELARLEAEFEAAGGEQITGGSLMDGTERYAGGNERYERICELRHRRGDATLQCQVKIRLTVQVTGELMSDGELRGVVSAEQIAADVIRCLRLDLSHSRTLGYAPDGNRPAYLDELTSIDSVTVTTIGRPS